MKTKEEYFEDFSKNIKDNKIVLFMKGNKDFPQCGFSATVVDILESCEADFLDINILKDPDMRGYLKEFSDWPTLPQIYINGEFVGGCDIIQDMYVSGEIQKLIARS